MTTLADCTAWLGHPNCKAFLRVIREGETNQTDSAYTEINGGGHFIPPPWVHPWPDGTPTTQGGKAAGAYQFLPSTWKRIDDALGLGGDFSPASQDVGAVYLIAGRNAISEVLAGDINGAIAKLAQEWVSLPHLGSRALTIFQQFGGALANAQIPQPVPVVPQGVPMDPLTLIGIIGPALQLLIPQVGTLFGGKKDAANAQLIGTVLNTVVQAAGTAQSGEAATLANAATAVEAMQADPTLTAAVQKAVLTHPDVMAVLEIGGGIAAARASSIAIQTADKPFWFNPMFWITMALLPMMYMVTFQVLFTLAGPYMVSNGVSGSPLLPNPWFAVIGFDPNTRTGLINLIVGFIFGGVTGVWFGTTVSKQKSDQAVTDQTAVDPATAK